jgi:phage-related holin
MKEFVKDWGYSSVHDLLETTLHYREFKPMIAMSLTLAGITSMIEQFVGLEPLMFVAWIALLLVELITGIKASLYEGKKLESKKFSRFIFKVFIYIVMISITHLLHIGSEGRFVSSVYGFIYWLIIDYISIQLIISVFENLSRLGFQESSKVFKTIREYLNKWFDLKHGGEEN